MIRKIQAMEKLANQRSKRPKEFDPSESSGLGLLDEMSLTELKERLSLLAMREQEPTFYYLALFKTFFETCLNIKISSDTISTKQIHEEKHPLTSWGSTIASTNHQAVAPTCKNENS